MALQYDENLLDKELYDIDTMEYDGHTGDPRLDLEYEREAREQGFGNSFIVPAPIKNFVTGFHQAIDTKDLVAIQRLYNNGFNKLTDSYFKDTPWPEAQYIEPIVGEDENFMILYKELYFRHIYARVQGGPTLTNMVESYYNYCDLFNFILNAEEPVHLELHNQWLWNIIDEFIYQFQFFTQFRSKLSKMNDEERDYLRSNPMVWNVHSVLNVLHCLVDKSNINQQLEVFSSGGDPDSVAGEFGRNSLYKMLGYFSLVGLLRLHSLLGDYYQALKVIDNIDFNRQNMKSQVPECQITMYYYIGFAYMMMRRYQDAIRTFSNILIFIQRIRQLVHNKAQLYDQIDKQNEQMFNLLNICLVLYPMKVDEVLMNQLGNSSYLDKRIRMQKGDIGEFTSTFSYACPKFLSPVPPNFDSYGNYHKEPLNQQIKVFVDEVNQQMMIGTIRSYLKLYTTLPLAKLATFMDMTVDDLEIQLMCFKHKMKNMVWSGSACGLDGEFKSGSDVDFYVDEGMIHIAETKVARRHGDFFIRQIHKFGELNRDIKANFPFVVESSTDSSKLAPKLIVSRRPNSSAPTTQTPGNSSQAKPPGKQGQGKSDKGKQDKSKPDKFKQEKVKQPQNKLPKETKVSGSRRKKN